MEIFINITSKASVARHVLTIISLLELGMDHNVVCNVKPLMGYIKKQLLIKLLYLQNIKFNKVKGS